MSDNEAGTLVLVSILHGEIAERFASEDPVGMFARLCAVSAALEAGSFRRAVLLAEHYLGTGKLPTLIRDVLHKYRTRAMVAVMKQGAEVT